MTAILFVVTVVFKRDKSNVDIRVRTIAVDILAISIATFLIIEKSRGSCVLILS